MSMNAIANKLSSQTIASNKLFNYPAAMSALLSLARCWSLSATSVSLWLSYYSTIILYLLPLSLSMTTHSFDIESEKKYIYVRRGRYEVVRSMTYNELSNRLQCEEWNKSGVVWTIAKSFYENFIKSLCILFNFP